MAQSDTIRALLYEGPATTPEIAACTDFGLHVCSALISAMRRRGEVEIVGFLGEGFWRAAIYSLTIRGVERTREADRARVDAELQQDLARSAQAAREATSRQRSRTS